jgi:hypothetical protein
MKLRLFTPWDPFNSYHSLTGPTQNGRVQIINNFEVFVGKMTERDLAQLKNN